MKNLIINTLFLIGLALILGWEGCTSNIPTDLDFRDYLEDNSGDVTLSLQVYSSPGGMSTRTEDDGIVAPGFEATDILYEKIHSLRVIIVRPDNTIEHNYFEAVPGDWASNKFKEINLKVSTDQGTSKLDVTANPKIQTRTERKRIYLIANEESLQPQSVVDYIKSLLPPHYVIQNGEKKLIPGAFLTEDKAAEFQIYNEWTPNSGNKEGEAVPMINNEGSAEKQFIPMTEFFDIDVTSDFTMPENQNVQKENLFVTRNLIKFQFEANSTTESFKINAIRFERLMRKEYLFPRVTYYPDKSNLNASNREIIEFETPGRAENLIRPYIFRPENFQFTLSTENTSTPSATYNPLLYFCESKNFEADNNNKPIYRVGIDLTFFNTDGTSQEASFDAETLDNLPYSLPRNSIVKVKITITERRSFDCTVTLEPYIVVDLEPSFGDPQPYPEENPEN